MEVDELVDAALVGFDRREGNHHPSLSDEKSVERVQRGAEAMIPNFLNEHAAALRRQAVSSTRKITGLWPAFVSREQGLFPHECSCYVLIPDMWVRTCLSSFLYQDWRQAKSGMPCSSPYCRTRGRRCS